MEPCERVEPQSSASLWCTNLEDTIITQSKSVSQSVSAVILSASRLYFDKLLIRRVLFCCDFF
jgi:hypothetical protein